MPPEKSAYALARYSRSPDSIYKSLEWVRTHDSQSFLENYYFQYGHASIADLGHAIFCFEGVSELAAVEIEDEPLWDGQAKSSRYQNFAVAGVVTPPELAGAEAEAIYIAAARSMLDRYHQLHQKILDFLVERTPRPEAMKPEAYRRTLSARAYDVARYLLFLGVPTNVGQVASIRTLEKQMRRLGASPYEEVRRIAAEMAQACAAPPACVWDSSSTPEPLAPTLARHADPDVCSQQARQNVAAWAAGNFPCRNQAAPSSVDLVRVADPLEEIVTTLLYAVTCWSFRAIHEQVSQWSKARQREVLDTALENRPARDELLREFRSGYAFLFDIVTDIGAYRDLHRHRRCQQIRQEFTAALGEDTPPLVTGAGLEGLYQEGLEMARVAREKLAASAPRAAHYLLPFSARVRFLAKMDFAEAEYIARVRSGVKGHFSYRTVAWQMKEKIMEQAPELGRLMQATPPWVEDPLQR